MSHQIFLLPVRPDINARDGFLQDEFLAQSKMAIYYLLYRY